MTQNIDITIELGKPKKIQVANPREVISAARRMSGYGSSG